MAILNHSMGEEGRVVPSTNMTEILSIYCIGSLLAELIKLWYNVMSCMRGQNSLYTVRDPAASEDWH